MLILLMDAIIDIKERNVYTLTNLIILLIAFLINGFNIKRILLALIIPIVLRIVNYIYEKEVIGYGDIDMLFVLGYYLGYTKVIYLFFFANLLALLFCSITRKKDIAYIPFIFIAYMIILLMKFD